MPISGQIWPPSFQESFETFDKASNPVFQACQTQTIARAANWVLKLEKLTAGHSIEIHDTLSQFSTYFSQFDLKMDNILDIFHELLTVLSDSLF